VVSILVVVIKIPEILKVIIAIDDIAVRIASCFPSNPSIEPTKHLFVVVVGHFLPSLGSGNEFEHL
jgi:hypothetical protein